MALKNFRTYQLAITLYRDCQKLKVKGGLRDQLDRASSSVVLNLAEGSAKHSRKDRVRFYQIAMGSLREVEAILELTGGKSSAVDQLGASLFRLIQNPGPDL